MLLKFNRMQELFKDLLTARKAALAGAKVLKKQFGKSGVSRIKEGSDSLVTDTDIAAEAAIIEVLEKESDYNIISEESGSREMPGDRHWIVDPLDGTFNFAHALPFFCVSVALAEGNDFLIGAVADPVRNKEYYAFKNGGAFCNGEPLPFLIDRKGVPALFLNHGHYPESKQRFAVITDRLCSGYNTRKLGTTALELCYVAAGSVRGFICSGDEIWDYAAGVVIATEAGCIFSDWKGAPWNGESSFVLVARPEIHGSLAEKIWDLQ